VRHLQGLVANTQLGSTFWTSDEKYVGSGGCGREPPRPGSSGPGTNTKRLPSWFFLCVRLEKVNDFGDGERLGRCSVCG